MKLRQKLAAVMAAAMVVTSVPVVTMASSKNTITRPSSIVQENDSFTDAATAPALKVKFEDHSAGAQDVNEEFYLTLTNAEWTDEMFKLAATQGGDIEITKVDDHVAKVLVRNLTTTGEVKVDGTSVSIPLLAKFTGGAASVAVTTEGSGSTITEGSYVFATTSSEVATVTAGSPTSFNREGKLGTITIAETHSKSMHKANGNYYALVELNDSDYEFDFAANGATTDNKEYVLSQSGDDISFAEAGANNKKVVYTKYEVSAKFTYGFAGKASTVNVYVAEDGDSMYVELPNNLDSSSKGRIELNNLYVKSTVKNPTEGNITVDVTGNVEEAKGLVVAVNGNYDAAITVADDKAVEILAGQKSEVNFTIKEGVDNTFTNGRAFDITVDNGYFMDAVLTNGRVDESKTLAAMKQAFASIEHKADNKTVKKYDAAAIAAAITDVEIEDEKVVGFTFKPSTTYEAQKLDGFTFKLDLAAAIDQKGEVKVSAISRDLAEAATAVIANIRPAVEVTSEAVVLKTGLMNQEGGKITITESEAGVLGRSEQIVAYLPEVKGISFSTSKDKLPEVTVKEGDIQISDVKIKTVENTDGDEVQALVMTVKRDSKTASTIEISNFHIDTDRTVAEGKYDVEIGGKALTSHNETIKVADFITIGTANTEDLGSNGLAKGTSTFVIGENKYTLNGVEKTMDAASFIQDPGYTMIPVRYVAEAFGVKGNDILFSKGVVTIFAGNRTVQLTNGSDVAVVNGAKVQMATKVVVKDGRTYAPVGEVARILGVSSSWDNTTKTATFTNK